VAKSDILSVSKNQMNPSKSMLFLIKATLVVIVLAILIHLYFNHRIDKLDEQVNNLEIKH
jgi:hypothetical protein